MEWEEQISKIDKCVDSFVEDYMELIGYIEKFRKIARECESLEEFKSEVTKLANENWLYRKEILDLLEEILGNIEVVE